MGANSASSDYLLTNSLRFRHEASAYLNRTPSSASNRKTYTYSAWVKKNGYYTTPSILFNGRNGTSTPYTILYWDDSKLKITDNTITTLVSSPTYRDTSSWYHIVWAVDTTQSTSSDRIKVYVNGEQITFESGTYPAQNYDTTINSTYSHRIGENSGQYLNSYIAELNFVDGQALTPSDFGQYNENNVWSPKKYTGTYGTNGFYLPFTGDITPTATAGFGGVAENVLADDYAYLISNTSTGSGFDLIKYDFGESINMIDYNVQDLKWTGGTSTFRIYTSDDDSSWTERASLSVSSSFQNYTGNLGVTARYVKIRATNFGTNGQAHLNYFNVDVDSSIFSDNSGNTNHWTPNNIDVLTDWTTDVPTLTSEDSANYPILNQNLRYFTYLGFQSGSLEAVSSANNIWQSIAATMAVPTSGKYYWEVKVTRLSTDTNCYIMTGIMPTYYGTLEGKSYAGHATLPNGWSYYLNNGYIYNNGANTGPYGTSCDIGDTIGVAIDTDNGKLWFSVNGTWQNSGDPTNGSDTNDATSFTSSSFESGQDYYPIVSVYNIAQASMNFGQQPFKYTPPTGYKKLNTFNLPDSSITDGSDYFAPVTYTGNGTSQDITMDFSPDLVWIKERSSTSSHRLYDTIRDVNNYLQSSSTDAEGTNAGNGLTVFNSDGFSVGSNTAVNQSGISHISWSWRGSDSTAVSNTDGTITSTVSANPTSGFSVVTWTGTGTSGQSVGHGLNQFPEMVIVKKRNKAENWYVASEPTYGRNYAYHAHLNTNGAWEGNNDPYYLGGQTSSTTAINLADGTSNNGGNENGINYVAYCWHSVDGYSKIGSYTGDGSADGPFIYTGFRPAFILWKLTSSTSSWAIWDATRATDNPINTLLFPDASNAESSGSSAYDVDFLSNGFKWRTSNSQINGSGSTYLYMAFAENPFKNSLAR